MPMPSSLVKRHAPPAIKAAVRRLRSQAHNRYVWARCLALGAADRALPAVLVLGAQKAGTTSFFHYLAQHPQIAEPTIKEIHYYDNHYDYGMSWYRAHFCKQDELRRTAGLTFEASPYYLFHPAAPRRVAADLPDARFVVMLRDPVARAYSHYWHERRYGREPLSFEDAVRAEDERLAGEEQRLADSPRYRSFAHQHFSYVARGRYAGQIRRWLQHFDESQFLFIKSETFFRDPRAQMQRAYDFLGIAPHLDVDWAPKVGGTYDGRIASDTRRRLEAVFAEANRELPQMIGAEFDWSR